MCIKVGAVCHETGNDPLVSQDGEGRVDLRPSGQHDPFEVDLFQGICGKGRGSA